MDPRVINGQVQSGRKNQGHKNQMHLSSYHDFLEFICHADKNGPHLIMKQNSLRQDRVSTKLNQMAIKIVTLFM